MRRLRALIPLVALLAGLTGCMRGALRPPVAPPGTIRVLMLADLHFDPFANAMLVPALLAAPPSRWEAIFATDPRQKPAGYRVDTNWALLRSAVRAMREAAPEPRVVTIAGDALAHAFHERFVHATGRRDAASYDRFVDATIAYLALVFDRAFPRAQFVITIGNNDGYCGDYESTPNSPFLHHMARAWAPLVDRGGAAPSFAQTFGAGGWYETRLFGTTRALVANSVFWSADYANACGDPFEPIGAEQMRFLRGRLHAAPAGTHWWMLTHIPPGIDTFASLRGLGLREMYRPEATRDFASLHARDDRPLDLVITGHTHMNDFRLASSGAGIAPVMLVPSITRFSGNDPAFFVATVRPDGSIADYAAYHDSSRFAGLGTRAWSFEYGFAATFGEGGVSVTALRHLQARLATDEVLRDRFYGEWYASGSLLGIVARSTWHRIWCAQTELEPHAYLRCRGKG